jgi:hypothetical protein
MGSKSTEITKEGLYIRVLDSETGKPYTIKDNQIVMCRAGKPFQLSFRTDQEIMNITVKFQGSSQTGGYFRASPGSWATFEHGDNDKTWVTLDSSTEDAKEVGITQADVNNGTIRFEVQRPRKQESVFRTRGYVPECKSTGPVFEKNSNHRFTEVGIAHGPKSNVKYNNAEHVPMDRSKDFTIVVRMIADNDLKEPKFSPIEGTIPTAMDLNFLAMDAR